MPNEPTASYGSSAQASVNAASHCPCCRSVLFLRLSWHTRSHQSRLTAVLTIVSRPREKPSLEPSPAAAGVPGAVYTTRLLGSTPGPARNRWDADNSPDYHGTGIQTRILGHDPLHGGPRSSSQGPESVAGLDDVAHQSRGAGYGRRQSSTWGREADDLSNAEGIRVDAWIKAEEGVDCRSVPSRQFVKGIASLYRVGDQPHTAHPRRRGRDWQTNDLPDSEIIRVNAGVRSLQGVETHVERPGNAPQSVSGTDSVGASRARRLVG